MNDLTKFDTQTLEILGKSFQNGIPVPGIKEIFLIETHIAGTTFLNLEEIESSLFVGSFIKMIREPNNSFDTLAILLYDQKGNKLGYVPKERNEILARLMDAGKLIFGKLILKERIHTWLKITVQIFLKD